MTPDEQEALSLRYGPDAFMVLPLASGRIAVLGYARRLAAIVDSWEEAKEVGARLAIQARAEAIERRPKVRAKLDLGDLGL